MTHPWRKQDPNAAAAWLATFASFRKSNIGPVPVLSRPTLTSMGLVAFEVDLPLTLRVIPIDDVSDATDDL